MAAVTEILYINTDGVTGVRGTPTSIGALDAVTAKGVSWAFQGDVTVAGDLTVAGDIISRGQVDVVIQDSFLDLGFGNYTTVAASGGFTVAMNRSASFTPYTTPAALAAITQFTNSTTFKYDSANSKLLTAGMVIAITNLSQAEAANEGLFVVNAVTLDAGTVYDVTIQTTGLGNAPWAQTAFVPAAGTSFPNVVAQGTAFQIDLAVLCVSDGTNFPTVSPAVWPKGTFLQAYFPDANDSTTAPGGFNADYAYNVIGGTTLQQAYNNSADPATIATAANKELRFTLNATGPFQVQGAASGQGAVEFGSTGLNALASFDVSTTGAIALNSTGGALGLGDVSGTGSINIGTLGNRTAINIGHRLNGDVVTTTTIEGVTVNVQGSSQGGTGTLRLDARGFGSPAYARLTSLSDINSSQIVIQAGDALSYTSDTVSIQALGTAGAINIGSAGSPNITIGNTAVVTASVEADTLNLATGAQAHTVNIASGTSGIQAINIGTGAGNQHTITIGDTSASVTNLLNLEAGQARVTVGGTNAGAQADNEISVETLATSGTINIGSAAFSHTINIGTSSTGAQSVEIGDQAAGNAGQTIIQGQNAFITAGGGYNGGQANKSISIQTQAGTGYIFLGTLGHAHNIAIGTDNNYTQTVYVGGLAASSSTLVQGGIQVGLRLNAESGAGITVRNNSGVVSLAAGQVVSLASGVTPTSTARPTVAKADAATGSTTRRFVGIVQGSGIGTSSDGYATSVAGTVAWVAWTSNAGGIPAAGDEGKPVFIESSTVDVAGVATMLAPSGSGESVQQIGFLVSDTDNGSGLYAVLLAPQFIGQIP